MAQLKDLICQAPLERCGAQKYPVLSMTMHDGIVLQSDRFKKSLASMDQSAYKVVKRNQLVVGFPIDEGVLYIQQAADEGIMSPAYDVWNVNQNRVDLEYLELCLHSPQSMMYYKTNLRGTTARRRSLPKDVLLALPIRLSDMEEQQHIAATIKKVKQLLRLHQQSLQSLDELIKAQFVEMFGDPEINPKGWDRQPLASAIENANNGMARRGNDPDGNIVMRLIELQKGYIDYSAPNRILLSITEQQRYMLVENDVLFARVNGNPENVGRCAVFHEIGEPVYHNDHIIRVHFDERHINAGFIVTLINSEYGVCKMKRQIKTSAGQYTISQDGIGAIDVIFPPITLQHQFASFVAQIDKSKFRCVTSRNLWKYAVKYIWDGLHREMVL